jgi:hypothetical protein
VICTLLAHGLLAFTYKESKKGKRKKVFYFVLELVLGGMFLGGGATTARFVARILPGLLKTEGPEM